MKALDWLEDFYFKYFSNSTRYSEVGWVRIAFQGFLFGLLISGILMDQLGYSWRISMFIFLGIFIPFAIVWIVVYFYHNNKLKKLGKRWK